MDFAEFEVETEKPVFVQFLSPFDGKPLFDTKEENGKKVQDLDKPVGVMLYGQDSQAFIRRQREIQEKKVAEAQRARNVKAITTSQAELEQNGRDTVIACTHSFLNVTWEGQDLGERREHFDAFFKKHKWAFDFCNSAIMDRANFQKASSQN